MGKSGWNQAISVVRGAELGSGNPRRLEIERQIEVFVIFLIQKILYRLDIRVARSSITYLSDPVHVQLACFRHKACSGEPTAVNGKDAAAILKQKEVGTARSLFKPSAMMKSRIVVADRRVITTGRKLEIITRIVQGNESFEVDRVHIGGI